MTKSFEEISKAIASQSGRPDANLANDSNHLGGIEAGDYATKAWVQEYHGNKESDLKQYVDQHDKDTLNAAKEYTNAMIRNQDFSNFAELDDLNALNTNLTNKINTDIANQKAYTDQKTQAIVDDVNTNFADVEDAINALNDNVSDLFQSVSDGKELIAEAITDKGVTTSANDSFSTMSSNIKNINTNQGMIVIPEGYMDTSDATATSDKILQGFTAYANGNKIHGTYVPSGGGSTGGVILGEDEVVATKIYGEAGVLTGGKISNLDNKITISKQNTYGVTVPKMALISTESAAYGTFVVASRKITENVDNEIVIYNISNNSFSHKDYNAKYSYSFSELGIEGELRCIAASPICIFTPNDCFVQITIGTSVAIYTFWFNAAGNNGNGSIGEASIYSEKTCFVIENPCRDINSITYSNTEDNTFAYFSQNRIHIVSIGWAIEQILEYKNVEVSTYQGNVRGLFRFSQSDRFLIFAPWGTLGTSGITNLMLLDDFRYVMHQALSKDFGESGWKSAQLLINSQDNFMIFCGLPYTLNYDLKAKTITYTQQSNTQIIPFNEGLNESCFACFSKDDKYVYAISSFNPINRMYPIATYKVDYLNLDTEWDKVSSDLATTGSSTTLDIVNSKAICFNPYYKEAGLPGPTESSIGFYYYYADPEIRDVIGLSYNGNFYKKTWQ